jgi:C-terminal processing protease CtpA/Prc
MTGLVISAVLFTPAAPVPMNGAPPAANSKLDRVQVDQFAALVNNLMTTVCDYYVRASLTPKELLAGAVKGLYDEVGQPIPKNVKDLIDSAETHNQRFEALREVRLLLGNHPNLAGVMSLFAAMIGFRHATDSVCGPASSRVNTYASIEFDFGVGIEIDGVSGMRWTMYQAEYAIASRLYPPTGYFGTPPNPQELPSPAAFPWRVKRVIPGSPAQRASIIPGDVITHFNGVEITEKNVDAQFSVFANPARQFDPRTGQPLPQERTLTLKRGDEKPFTRTLKTGEFKPESAYGVVRLADDKWDCMLDRKNKIGYIRLGPIETGVDLKVDDMLADLMKQGCRALILDLRWCPGGYVDPGTNIAGKFLPEGATISKMVFTHPQRTGAGGDRFAPPGGGRYAKLPLAILVGHDTIGGGELIASALRDNDRCVVIGQRTFGRATILNAIPTGLADVQFRMTTGVSLRPNGKSRQRMPESQPTDDWGIRPDEGLEVPITLDKSQELRQQAELHALRPADSRVALPFDDPAADPYRLAALNYFRKKLGAK